MVRYLQASYDVSERRACQVVKVARSVQRYCSIANRHELLRARIRELALLRYRYGYRRLHILLRREGFDVGRALVYRLYCGPGDHGGMSAPRIARHRCGRRPRPTKSGAWTLFRTSCTTVTASEH
jgi:putative transposase